MSTIRKLISSWRQWINRNQTFHNKELDEMEDHLIEEIDYLVKRENLSEEEAFHKAMLEMGKREVLDKDFRKTKTFSILNINYWIHSKIWTILLCLILGFSFIIADLVYSKNHIEETIKINPRLVNLIAFQKIPADPLEDISFIYWWTGKYMNRERKELDKWMKEYASSLKNNKNDRVVKIWQDTGNPNPSWKDAKFNCKTTPKSISHVNIDHSDYYLVLDEQNVLWISNSLEFTPNTPHFQLKSVGTRDIVFTQKNVEDEPSSRIFSEWNRTIHYKNNDFVCPPFTYIHKNSPNLIHLSNEGKISFFQIEFFQMSKTFIKSPDNLIFKGKEILMDNWYEKDRELEDCILWNEVEIIRKPIHLFPFLLTKVKDSFNRYRGTQNTVEFLGK